MIDSTNTPPPTPARSASGAPATTCALGPLVLGPVALRGGGSIDGDALLVALALAFVLLLIAVAVRRVRADAGLRVLAGRGYSAWRRVAPRDEQEGSEGTAPRERGRAIGAAAKHRRAGQAVFWGRLEPRDGGIELRFDRAYATDGEPRRSALLLDGHEALRFTALVRAHTPSDLSATLVRDEVVRRAEAARTSLWRGVRPLWFGLVETVDRWVPAGSGVVSGSGLGSGSGVETGSGAKSGSGERPLQSARFLEARRGERVVVELDTGARLGGRLVAVGRRWLALVDAGDQTHSATPGDTLLLSTTTVDAPVALERDGRGIELSGAKRPFVVDEIRDDERSWKPGVVLLPGAPLYLPWYGDMTSNVRARLHAARGVDLLVPRSSARVVFAGDDEERDGTKA